MKLLIRRTESHDWVEVSDANGHVVFTGHSIPSHMWVRWLQVAGVEVTERDDIPEYKEDQER